MRDVFLLWAAFSLADSRTYVFDRPICTGLGDRFGTMLSLAALARLENATVGFQWCEDVSPILSRMRPYMPSWVGFNYSLVELKDRFVLPAEIKFVSDLSHWSHLPRVQWGAPLPAEMGSDALPRIAWRTMRMGAQPNNIAESFRDAYQNVTKPLARVDRTSPFVVLHLRGPDQNTYWTTDYDNRDRFCTAEVVRELWARSFPVHVVSNNLPWAVYLLGTKAGRFHMNASASEYDDFALLLSASAIIQHAGGGWSSYSSVPSLVTRVPMINTYDINRPSHRFHHFRSQQGLPPNFYDCQRIGRFMQALMGHRFG